ncbi:MAG: type I-C CRISPR-associated protein Cas5c [Clostridiaceae bacterium]|jgi:CRISPR-associated protein Cas5d|nr:type I-C CRISPR-associated protein Cas5c [Clostridiaceae bacterium]
MGYGIKLRVWGNYALFSRPELKVERVTYDVMTPSAARGILDSVYWHPGLTWVVDKIHVLKPLKFENIRRNEVNDKISPQKAMGAAERNDGDGLEIFATESRSQRAALVLKDVEYVIEAHFVCNKNEENSDEKKHYNIALRRMRRGECFKQPCFGTREFSAFFELIEGDVPKSELTGEVDLGYMLYDMEFKNKPDKDGAVVYSNDADPVFFRPKMVDGVIDVAEWYKKEAFR